MKITKNSTAYRVLFQLYFYGPSDYNVLYATICNVSEEAVKDSTQKLVRAGYITKIHTSRNRYYAITNDGTDALAKKLNTVLAYNKPCTNGQKLYTQNKNNYENVLFDTLSLTINGGKNYFPHFKNIWLLDFKAIKKGLSTDELDKVRGNSCSFAIVRYPDNSFLSSSIELYPIFYISKPKASVQDKAELNAIEMMKRIIKNQVNRVYPVINVQINVKCIFICRDYYCLYEIMDFNKRTEILKHSKKYRNHNRTYGKLVSTSILGDGDKLFLIPSHRITDEMVYRIFDIVFDCYNYNDFVPNLLNKGYITGFNPPYIINLVQGTFRAYYDAYLSILNNSFYFLGKPANMELPIVTDDEQTYFLNMINNLNKVYRAHKLQDNIVLFQEKNNYMEVKRPF